MKNTDIAAHYRAQNQGAALMHMLIYGAVWVAVIVAGFFINRALSPTNPEDAAMIGALIGAAAFGFAWLASRAYRRRTSISTGRPAGDSTGSSPS